MLVGINWFAVLVAALLGFAAGAVWYGPVFGKTWMKEIGKQPEDLGSPARAMGLTGVTTLITAVALAVAFDLGEVDTWLDGMLWGLTVGVFFVATTMYSDSLFHGQSTRLVLINIGHRVIYFTVMGTVLGGWAN